MHGNGRMFRNRDNRMLRGRDDNMNCGEPKTREPTTGSRFSPSSTGEKWEKLKLEPEKGISPPEK